MTIPWMYLDKRAASVCAIKDLPSMQHIVWNYSDDIGESKAHLTSLQSTMPSGSPGTANPHAHETQVASTIDLIDIVKERYDQAIEYMVWFRPAWEMLSDNERHILSSFYQQSDRSMSDVVKALCDELGYERSSIYRMRDKALDHITLLLYGK